VCVSSSWISHDGQLLDAAALATAVLARCILSGRMKKGGWFAKLTDGSASGTITDASQMPHGLEVGQQLVLKINGINLDKRFASFIWCVAQSQGC
jgi:hypothetical protein